MREAMGYVLSLPGVCHAIVGCETPAQEDDNADFARAFVPLTDGQRHDLEERTRANAAAFTYFKKADGS